MEKECPFCKKVFHESKIKPHIAVHLGIQDENQTDYFNRNIKEVIVNQEGIIPNSEGVIGGAWWAAAPPIIGTFITKKGQKSRFCPTNNLVESMSCPTNMKTITPSLVKIGETDRNIETFCKQLFASSP